MTGAGAMLHSVSVACMACQAFLSMLYVVNSCKSVSIWTILTPANVVVLVLLAGYPTARNAA